MLRQDEYDPDELLRDDDYDDSDMPGDEEDEEEELILGEGHSDIEVDEDGVPFGE